MKLNQGEDANKKVQETNKNVGVALKSTIQKEDYDHNGSDEDEKMAMFSRKFNKFVRMKKFGNGRQPQKRDMIKGESSKRGKKTLLYVMSARN